MPTDTENLAKTEREQPDRKTDRRLTKTDIELGAWIEPDSHLPRETDTQKTDRHLTKADIKLGACI